MDLEFHLLCRECFRLDEITQRFIDVDDFDLEKHITEFEVMNYIDSLEIESLFNCYYCNSRNLEKYYIKLDGNELFNLDKLKRYCENTNSSFLVIDIKKSGNRLKCDTDGTSTIDRLLYTEFINKIIETIKNRPSSNFINSIKGNFSICVSGRLNNNIIESVVIEEFTNLGLNRNEIFKCLNNIIKQHKLEIEIEDTSEYIESDPFDCAIFKGCLFQETLYFDDDEFESGTPFSIAYFDFNDEIIIGVDCKNDSPHNWLLNNKQNEFHIVNSYTKINKNNKSIYLATKVLK